MATLVRERRHQQALRLSLPPPIPTTKFRSPTYSPVASPATSPGSPVFEYLSEFKKLAVLGHGNGGTVYKVLHKTTSSIYALKALAGTHNKQSTREAEIQKRLDSPYIVRCHGVFEVQCGDDEDTGDSGSIVMEHVEGGSVQGLLKVRQRLSEEEIAMIVGRVLRGLQYLHSKAMIVHGDIKPSNLLVGPGGEVKIADFGASCSVGVQENGGEVGTCAYMSPERLDRERWGGGGKGFAGDVWSVGVVALECYLGRFPLVGRAQRPDWPALMCAVCFGDGVEFSEMETASAQFRSFVGRCLERDWRKRATVDELLRHPFVI